MGIKLKNIPITVKQKILLNQMKMESAFMELLSNAERMAVIHSASNASSFYTDVRREHLNNARDKWIKYVQTNT